MILAHSMAISTDQTGWEEEWFVVNTQTEGDWFTGTRFCQRVFPREREICRHRRVNRRARSAVPSISLDGAAHAGSFCVPTSAWTRSGTSPTTA
jgi:hypothetical protein